MASPAVDFARNNQQRFLSELKDLLRIPSVSTLEEHKPDVQKPPTSWLTNCAASVWKMLRSFLPRTSAYLCRLAPCPRQANRALLRALRRATARSSRRMEDSPSSRRSAITTFTREAQSTTRPTLDGSEGPRIAHEVGNGKLPINVKVIFEGEEESVANPSPSMSASRRPSEGRFRAGLRHRTLRSQPPHALCRPARLVLYRNRSLRRQDRSALRCLRGAAPNPFFALIEIISKLKDSKGHVLIPASTRRKGSEQRRTQSLETIALQRGDVP